MQNRTKIWTEHKENIEDPKTGVATLAGEKGEVFVVGEWRSCFLHPAGLDKSGGATGRLLNAVDNEWLVSMNSWSDLCAEIN